MTQYSALLDTMMDAILADDANSAGTFLHDKKDFPATVQLNAYIEGYQLRLLEAVSTAYPALLHYLGKASFEKLAVAYIAAHPSRYFNLDKYAIAFTDYVVANSDDVAACELARLEGAIHDVYQREETPAAALEWAQSQTLDSLAAAPLLPRAASCLLAFSTVADDYVTAFRAGEKPGMPAQKANWLIVLRHRNLVNRLALEEGEYVLLSLLSQGLTLAVALEDERLAAFIEHEDFAASLQKWLARWVSEGVLRQPEAA